MLSVRECGTNGAAGKVPAEIRLFSKVPAVELRNSDFKVRQVVSGWCATLMHLQPLNLLWYTIHTYNGHNFLGLQAEL